MHAMDLVQQIRSWVPDLAHSTLPRYQVIAQAIAEAINGGQIVTGEKLPPHRTLASALNVTVGTISRAYSQLEQEGKVIPRIGDGTYVQARFLPQSMPATESVQRNTDSDLIDLGQNVILALGQEAALAKTLQDISQDDIARQRVLDYQPESGHSLHRALAGRWLTQFHLSGEADRVAITNGAQHALACLCRILTSPGDTILCEALSYPGIVALAHQMRLQLISVEIDSEGIVPEALEQACKSFHSRLLFCVPTLHNPTTATMRETRRRQICDIARRHHLNIIEDAVPAPLLREQPSSLASLLPEQVFFVTGFSKSVAAGLRVGFIQAPQAWSGKLAAVLRANCWMATPLAAEVVCRWIEDGTMHALLDQQRQAVAERQQLVERIFEGLSYATHPEGNHIWLNLPAPWRTSEFTTMLRKKGVVVKPSDAFAVGRTPAPHAVRICLSGEPQLDKLAHGLRTIALTLKEGPGAYWMATA